MCICRYEVQNGNGRKLEIICTISGCWNVWCIEFELNLDYGKGLFATCHLTQFSQSMYEWSGLNRPQPTIFRKYF